MTVDSSQDTTDNNVVSSVLVEACQGFLQMTVRPKPVQETRVLYGRSILGTKMQNESLTEACQHRYDFFLSLNFSLILS